MVVSLTLAMQMAERLRTLLADSDAEIPAIGVLAQRWQVSYTTMAAAVRLLVREGLLDVQPGRAPRRCRAQPPTLLNGDAGVAASLRESLSSGEWRRGEALPKETVLRQRLGCGRSSLSAACRILAQEGLIHRHGRAWRVGGAMPIRRQRQDVPHILLIGEKDRFWLYQLGSSISAFYRRCVQELDAAGYRLHFIDWQDREAVRQHVALPAYRGCIVMAEAPDVQLVALHRLVNAAHKPVAFFDNGDRHPQLAEQVPGVTRFALDEHTAMTALVAAIADRGHVRIGVPIPPFAWCRRRAEFLKAAAAQCNPAVEVVVIPLSDRWATDYSGAAFRTPDDFLASILGQRQAVSRARARQVVRSHCGELFTLLEQGVTLIVGLNDHFAREYQMALDFAQVAVPAACGLIGIDNHAQTPVFGLSTCDTDFDRLGYLAAHLLIGDIPIPAGRRGTIASQLRFIDRGSVAVRR